MPLDPVKPMYVRPRPPRRRRSRVGAVIGFLVMIALVGGVLGAAAVATNAIGVGERFDSLKDRVALALNPPPDRAIPDEELVTPEPDATDEGEEIIDPETTPQPTPVVSLVAGQTPPPTPRPTPRPVKKKVDLDILQARGSDPADSFNSEIDHEWCAPAATQIVLDVLGFKNASDDFQRELVSRIGDWESWKDSHNGDWGPAAMRQALEAYGASGYVVKAYERRQDALRESAKAIMKTGAPVILLAWRGAHAWVMTGFRANADPTVWRDAKVTGTYILDPWYPRISSIWGASDGPGVFQDTAEMERNFLPWQRPEGAYPGRDGNFIVVLPTQSVGKAKPLRAG
jgi:peptidase C39-like protein